MGRHKTCPYILVILVGAIVVAQQFRRGEGSSPDGLGTQSLQVHVEYGNSTYRISVEYGNSTYGLYFGQAQDLPLH